MRRFLAQASIENAGGSLSKEEVREGGWGGYTGAGSVAGLELIVFGPRFPASN